VFEALEIAWHVVIEERDPDTRVDGEPAVLPGEHVGGGSGVEQASEPAASDDEIVPMADTERLRDAFPPGIATLRVMPDTNHNTVASVRQFYEALLQGPWRDGPTAFKKARGG